jgi:hypothetical protein
MAGWFGAGAHQLLLLPGRAAMEEWAIRGMQGDDRTPSCRSYWKTAFHPGPGLPT